MEAAIFVPNDATVARMVELRAAFNAYRKAEFEPPIDAELKRVEALCEACKHGEALAVLRLLQDYMNNAPEGMDAEVWGDCVGFYRFELRRRIRAIEEHIGQGAMFDE